ncbi:hypothetical protein V2I01_34075 [Micromonospora sp. BRA006-A]|nr:hypothetical protein [Micromonospora sp. BRA006-A]
MIGRADPLTRDALETVLARDVVPAAPDPAPAGPPAGWAATPITRTRRSSPRSSNAAGSLSPPCAAASAAAPDPSCSTSWSRRSPSTSGCSPIR